MADTETYAMPLDIQCFLMGYGPLEGVWFGEKHPTREGNFWWRAVIRERVTNTRATPSADAALSATDGRKAGEANAPCGDLEEARCGDVGANLCNACSQPIGDLTQYPGCGGPLTNLTAPVSPSPDALLREALGSVLEDLQIAEREQLVDPHIIVELRSLCSRHGYGNVMASTSALWRYLLGEQEGGAFVAGPCLGTVRNRIAEIEAALASKDRP